MPWITFTQEFNYDHRPNKAVCQLFKVTGDSVLVTQEIADAALERGVAKKATKPSKEESPKA